MTYFGIEINNRGAVQEFMMQAESLIDAHMKAIDFAKLIDSRIEEKFGVKETSEITLVSKWRFLRANDDGLGEYFEENRKNFEVIAFNENGTE